MDENKKKDTRNSRQRNIIVQCLEKNPRKHLTVEDIHQAAKEIDDGIGIATVYRNLKLLEDQGLIKKVYISSDTAPCYEIKADDVQHTHHHLVCQKCGAISDVELDLMEAIERIIEVTKGFSISDHKVIFYGSCANCKDKDKAEKSSDQ